MFGMFGISDSGQLSECLSEFGVGSDLENSRSPNRFPGSDGRCGHRFLSENFRRKIFFYGIDPKLQTSNFHPTRRFDLLIVRLFP